MCVCFAQVYSLVGTVVFPLLVADPAQIHFGEVRAGAARELVVRLRNEGDMAAKWTARMLDRMFPLPVSLSLSLSRARAHRPHTRTQFVICCSAAICSSLSVL